MKKYQAIILSICVAAAACSNAPDKVSTSNALPEAKKQMYRSTGVVKRIDKEEGMVTVDHDDIPGYMSPMEMTEPVTDRTILSEIKVGDKVEFEILRTGSEITYTKFSKIGEVAIINGSETYKTNCAECHGANGEGAKKGIPLIKGHALHHSEAEHIRQVTDGEGDKMPPFRDKLTAEHIKEVVRFVREDIQKSANRDDSSKHKH